MLWLAKSNYDSWIDEDKNPLRFTSAWDPVSMLDYDFRVTYKSPDVNLYFAKNAVKSYTNPNLENIINSVKPGCPDPLMGQHKMSGTYYNQSSAKYFTESGSKAIIAGNTMGATVL